MKDQRTPKPTPEAAPAPTAYEPPRVESVLTPSELERQAHYAGGIGGSQVAG